MEDLIGDKREAIVGEKYSNIVNKKNFRKVFLWVKDWQCRIQVYIFKSFHLNTQ